MSDPARTSLIECRAQLRDDLLAGRIEVLGDSVLSLNCSRCGRPYSEHPHNEAESRELDRSYHPNHAYRTQPHVGRLLHPRGDGLVYEPDGRWDAPRYAEYWRMLHG